MKNIKYLVLVPSFHGPVAQIWHDLLVDGGGKLQPHIAMRPLREGEEAVDLKELAKRIAA
jgi:hypothetical protein